MVETKFQGTTLPDTYCGNSKRGLYTLWCLTGRQHSIADTGCQSCLTGMNMAHSLGLKQKDLIPVRMKMNAANKAAIGILGAFFIQLLVKSLIVARFQIRQISYVTEDNEKFFLSREACHNLGLIPDIFPTIGGMTDEPNAVHTVTSYNCPK